jgi:hypothetical protein
LPPAIAHTTNHIRNGLSGGFFSSLLDLKPYQDERDDKLLRRMAAATEKGRMRMGFRAYRVRDRRHQPTKKTKPSANVDSV